METTNSIVEEVMLRIDETEKMHDYTMATDTVRVIVERLKSAHEREMERYKTSLKPVLDVPFETIKTKWGIQTNSLGDCEQAVLEAQITYNCGG